MDYIMQILTPMLSFLSAQYGIVGTVIGYMLFVIAPMMTILLEVAEMVVSLTETKSDDQVVSEVRAAWNKILPYMEMLPHANLPLSATMLKIMGMIKHVANALKGAITGWKSQ